MRGQKVKYTLDQLQFIQANSVTPRKELTAAVNLKFDTGYSTDNIKSLCTRNGWKTGRTGCFEKGHIPAPNARPHGPNSTSFKKGNKPINYRPVGSERTNVDGYREVKIADGMFQWRLKQRVVWEGRHGVKLKETDIIRFKDTNKLNCDIDNLEKFTRGEHAILNRMDVNSYPEEVKPVAKNMVRLMAATSQIERGHSHD